MGSWYKEFGEQGDIVVSTRIRIARNLSGIPFPSRLDPERLKEVNRKVFEAINKGNSGFSSTLKFIQMDEISDIEAESLVERHLISPGFAYNRKGRALILSSDETISIMLGEEDHIRIQLIMPGFCLDEAYDIANKIDDLLSETLDFAYDEQLGYLTECPTNLGTGLRASVMLHLPALEASMMVSQISTSVGKLGLTIRGMYGEGSKSKASLYQLSNQVTLGIPEKAAIENLKVVVKQTMAEERNQREKISSPLLEDSIYRSLGILRYARILNSEEMMTLLSRLKLGISMGIIDDVDKTLPILLMVQGQPATLQLNNGSMDTDQRDRLRAKLVREKLAQSK
ncbi:MAG TPA: protein arginine kinase [Clostridiales bacterium]|nr:protein arginine kinase [Clostridiales bacterium]